jgi:hypothetical protein
MYAQSPEPDRLPASITTLKHITARPIKHHMAQVDSRKEVRAAHLSRIAKVFIFSMLLDIGIRIRAVLLFSGIC